MALDLLALYDSHAGAVYRYHLARTGDPEAAEDLTSATFYGALALLPDAPPEAGLAWLGGLAVRALRAYLRSGQTGGGPPRSVNVPRPGVTPGADEARRRFAMGQVSQALRALPHEQADLLALHFFAGLPAGALVELFHRALPAVQRVLAAAPFPGDPADAAGLLRPEYRDSLRAALVIEAAREQPPARRAARLRRPLNLGLPGRPAWLPYAALAGLLLLVYLLLTALFGFAPDWFGLANSGLPQRPVAGPIERAAQNLPGGASARLGKGLVRALDAAADGRLAVGSSASICLYSPELVQAWCRWPPRPVTRVAFSPDGARLAYGDDNGLVAVLSTVDGATMSERSFGAMQITGLGWLTNSRLAAAILSGEVTAWDVDAGTLPWGPQRFGSTLHDLRVARLEGGSQWVALAGDAGLVLLDGPSGQPLRQEAADSTLQALAFRPGGSAITAALVGPDGARLRTWELPGMTVLVDMALPQPAAALAYSAAGALAAGHGAGVSLWQAGQNQPITLEALPGAPLLFEPSGERLLLVTSAGWVTQRDARDGHQRAGSLDDYNVAVRALVWRWGEDNLNMLDASGFLTVWDLDRPARFVYRVPFEINPPAAPGGPPLPLADGDEFLAVDDQRRMAAWQDGSAVLLVNLDSRILNARLEAPDGESARVLKADFSPGGAYLLTGDQQGRLRLWSTGDGRLLADVPGLTPGSTITAIAWRSGVAPGVAATPGPEPLQPQMQAAVAWEMMGRAGLDLLDLPGGALQRLPELDRVAGRLAWSADGRYLAAGLGSGVAVWDVQQPALLWTTSDAAGWVGALAISPDGRYLAAAGQDVLLWELKSGRLRKTYQGHPLPVTVLAFGKETGVLVSADEGGEILVWRLP